MHCKFLMRQQCGRCDFLIGVSCATYSERAACIDFNMIMLPEHHVAGCRMSPGPDLPPHDLFDDRQRSVCHGEVVHVRGVPAGAPRSAREREVEDRCM